MDNVSMIKSVIESGLLHLPRVTQGRPRPADRLGLSLVDQDPGT